MSTKREQSLLCQRQKREDQISRLHIVQRASGELPLMKGAPNEPRNHQKGRLTPTYRWAGIRINNITIRFVNPIESSAVRFRFRALNGSRDSRLGTEL